VSAYSFDILSARRTGCFSKVFQPTALKATHFRIANTLWSVVTF